MIKVLKVLSICLCVAVCFVTAPLSMVQAQVTITVGNGSGAVGSDDNPIDVILNNPSEKVRAVVLAVCDVDDYLSCSSCDTTVRTSNFICAAAEQQDGCTEVTLLTFGEDVIEEGNGPIFTLNCDVSPSAPVGGVREVSTDNEDIGNEFNLPLDVSSAPGEFRFTEATTTTTTGPPTTTVPPTTTTTINGGGCTPEVNVECTDDDFCPGDDCTTCTAVTECDGEIIDGTYEWELNDEVTGETGDTIEICPGDLDVGLNTLTAFDTTNGVDGSEPVILGGSECESDCAIDVIRDSLSKSHWFPLPIVFRIETFGIDSLNIRTPITIECEADGRLSSILQTGKYVQPNLGTNTTVIWQSALIWPALFTQSLGMQSEICAVTIGDCQATDIFELEYLSFIGIPLSE